MSYGFHAAAPSGEWINDPNALTFRDGRYQLYVQHASDAPEFRRIGWGRLSSPDLLTWRWEGVELPPADNAYRYSGSLAGDRLFFTDHDPTGPCQRQRQAMLSADGTITIAPHAFGPEGRNARDPFVWKTARGWRMLVACPCDWNSWRDDPPSTLQLWGSTDLDRWRLLATVGPWSPPGVLWEVPAVVDFGEDQALILSLVDRRGDETRCEVRYWLGRLSDAGFAPLPGFPDAGVLLDHGPDFYAAIPNTPDGWPSAHRVLVGWASSWRTARAMAWPEQRGGGPIAMPRLIERVGDRLALSPVPGRAPDAARALDPGGSLTLRRDSWIVEIAATQDGLSVRREGDALWTFHCNAPVGPTTDSMAQLYRDGPVVELFWRGVTITAILPGEGEIQLT